MGWRKVGSNKVSGKEIKRGREIGGERGKGQKKGKKTKNRAWNAFTAKENLGQGRKRARREKLSEKQEG